LNETPDGGTGEKNDAGRRNTNGVSLGGYRCRLSLEGRLLQTSMRVIAIADTGISKSYL
jgi:hypothetical protein